MPDKNLFNQRANLNNKIDSKLKIDPKLQANELRFKAEDLRSFQRRDTPTSINLSKEIKNANDLNPILQNALNEIKLPSGAGVGDKSLSFSLSIKF